MKTLQELSLRDIMPDSLLRDSNVNNTALAIDPELRLVTGAADEALILSRLDSLSESVIDLLAWQFHVDFYELADSLETKRELVRYSLLWHMKKGTKYAIIKALNMLGIDAEYHNWYEFGGRPYTFTLNATVRPEYYLHSDHEQLIANIWRAVNDSKAARSALVALNTNIQDSDLMRLYYGIARGLSGFHKIEIATPESPGASHLRIGIGSGLTGYRVMWPEPPAQEMICRAFVGFLITEFGNMDIRCDFQQPPSEFAIGVRHALIEVRGGELRLRVQEPDSEHASETLRLGQAVNLGGVVRVASERYSYKEMLADLFRYAGEPLKELAIKCESGVIMTEHRSQGIQTNEPDTKELSQSDKIYMHESIILRGKITIGTESE